MQWAFVCDLTIKIKHKDLMVEGVRERESTWPTRVAVQLGAATHRLDECGPAP